MTLNVLSAAPLDEQMIAQCIHLHIVESGTDPAADAEKLKPITEMVIDTGYSKEELEQLVPLGTPVGFKPVYGQLADGRIYGKAFDDKACGTKGMCAARHSSILMRVS